MVMIGRRELADPLAFPNLSRRSVIGDAAVGFVLLVLMVAVSSGLSTTVQIASLLIGLAVMCRRVTPSLMMTLAVASAVLQVVTYDVAVGACLLYSVLYYTAGNHPNALVRRGSFVVAAVGSLVAAWVYPRSSAWGAADESATLLAYLMTFLGIAVLLVGSWTFGFIRYQRHSVEQARIAEQMSELERRRLLDLYDEQAARSSLARDMHDVVAHSLAVVVAQAEGARFTLDSSPEAAKEALGVIADTARQALADVRGVLEELRSTESTADHTRTDRDQLYARMRAAGMTLQTTEIGDADTVSPLSVRVAFAVLTESLTNALKYGDLARPVEVRQDWTDGCRLTVANALSDKPLAPGGAGHGIVGMVERAELAGGTLTSAAVDGRWLVELVVPARPEGPA
ncbi:sensor histidine kinase [Gordonia neofelifaecis]|uniref:histidine kinase n=1 Tax=Gordonia neofelifaecis NRRL B-59395 TaxID=644548 RepID=F1YE33_9ACTN|nr:histidine kinase [Gordonia neofelifaecis]EGD57123.1 two-component system, sensor protein [Gordonia neofelifaecis NRRL B-59395]